MPYYIKCPNCGANLDPGEICDCKTEKKEIVRRASFEGGSRILRDKLQTGAGLADQRAPQGSTRAPQGSY